MFPSFIELAVADDDTTGNQIYKGVAACVAVMVTIIISMWLSFYYQYNHAKSQHNGMLMYVLRTLHPHLRSYIVLAITLVFILRLFLRAFTGKCHDDNSSPSPFAERLNCNPNTDSSNLPKESILGLMLLPLLFSLTMREISVKVVLICWLAVVLAVLIAVVGVAKDDTYVAMIIVYILPSLAMIFENYRYNKSLFLVTLRLRNTLKERDENADQVHATEMRHMIANVAHDLKTPLTSFLSGIEIIGEVQVKVMVVRGEKEEVDGINPASAVVGDDKDKLKPTLSPRYGTNKVVPSLIADAEEEHSLYSSNTPNKAAPAHLHSPPDSPDHAQQPQQDSPSGQQPAQNPPYKPYKGDLLRFEVSDHGIGLSDEAMLTLFNPFKQAQRLAGGTGLGLYSLARRIEALRGDYGVYGRPDEQQGSVFWFAIPYRPDRVSAGSIRRSIFPRRGAAGAGGSALGLGDKDGMSTRGAAGERTRDAVYTALAAVASGDMEGEASATTTGEGKDAMLTLEDAQYPPGDTS
eukprot:gene25063-30272_t